MPRIKIRSRKVDEVTQASNEELEYTNDAILQTGELCMLGIDFN